MTQVTVIRKKELKSRKPSLVASFGTFSISATSCVNMLMESKVIAFNPKAYSYGKNYYLSIAQIEEILTRHSDFIINKMLN